MANVTFFFDPECPWTWRASRWLVAVAPSRGLDIEWRPCSLLVLNGGNPPDEERVAMQASHRALRLVGYLWHAGRHHDAGRFYGAIGRRTFEAGETITDGHVAAAVSDVHLDAELPLLGDASLDEAVEASTVEALRVAGPGVGSPIVALAGAERGLHGPVLAAVPDEKESLALWDAFECLVRMPGFFELKRGRG